MPGYAIYRADDFYSRPCGRGDLKIDQAEQLIYISTHAPAGGATG